MTCDFEGGYCQWEVVPDHSGFEWRRKSAEEIAGSGEQGPTADAEGDLQGHFLIAQAATSEEKFAKARIVSPQFWGDQHPKECFHFWFQLQVSAK